MEAARLEAWRQDLLQLDKELKSGHKELFHYLDQRSYESRLQDLLEQLEDLDDLEVLAALARLLAALGDAHTTLIFPARNFLPLKFLWFPEGIYVTGAAGNHGGLVGRKVEAVGGIPIGEVLDELTEVISHENEFFLRSQIPRYLSVADLLYGMSILENPGETLLTLSGTDGSREQRLGSVDAGAAQGISEPWQEDLPLYRRHPGRLYWYEFLEPSSTLYFHYGSCREMVDAPLEGVFEAIKGVLETAALRKLVIDLRGNLGGDSLLLEPFIQWLQAGKLQPGFPKLFVIIGRETFSSALLNAYALKERAGAILVGEPSGGKPDSFGEVRTLTTGNFGLKVRYSTMFYSLEGDEGRQALMPEQTCIVTWGDYVRKGDPCMEWILAAEPGCVEV